MGAADEARAEQRTRRSAQPMDAGNDRLPTQEHPSHCPLQTAYEQCSRGERKLNCGPLGTTRNDAATPATAQPTRPTQCALAHPMRSPCEYPTDSAHPTEAANLLQKDHTQAHCLKPNDSRANPVERECQFPMLIHSPQHPRSAAHGGRLRPNRTSRDTPRLRPCHLLKRQCNGGQERKRRNVARVKKTKPQENALA